MKTITIDDVAYERLKAWKTSPRDSFPNVLKRIVLVACTLVTFLNFVDTYRTGSLPRNDVFEASIGERSEVKSDP